MASKYRMTRRDCRVHLMSMLFQTEFHEKDEWEKQIGYYLEDMEPEPDEKSLQYVREKFWNMLPYLEEIDKLIEEVSEGWKLKRMLKVDLAIMRLAVYEMKFDEEIPVSVAINEAVEIAKQYGQDNSPAFINGILAKIAKRIEKEGAASE